MKNLHKKSSGFTLVEVAIVLVIVGLLIGGILVARSMITSAEVQAMTRQVGQYDIAIEQFQEKFRGIPGDSSKFNTTGAENDGDNDGKIEDGTAGENGRGSKFAGEVADFWTNLETATQIKVSGNAPKQQFAQGQVIDFNNLEPASGNRFSPTITGNLKNRGTTINIPPSKLGNTKTGVLVTNDYLNPTVDNSLTTRKVEGAYILANFEAIDEATDEIGASLVGSIRPIDALAIDKKLDDGVANTGNVFATPETPTCHNSGASYATDTTGEVCGLIIGYLRAQVAKETTGEVACGNGIVEGVEECDDGNTTNDDACSNSCVSGVCGDNIVQSGLGETCDDGNTTDDANGCDASCQTACNYVDTGNCTTDCQTTFDTCTGNCTASPDYTMCNSGMSSCIGGVCCSSDCGGTCMGSCQSCNSCTGSCDNYADGTPCGSGGSCSGGSCTGECYTSCNSECQTCNGWSCDNVMDGTACSGGTCQSGSCQGDPCSGISCGMNTTGMCDEFGSCHCSNGGDQMCSDTAPNYYCCPSGDTCSSGSCVGDPCSGVTCQSVNPSSGANSSCSGGSCGCTDGNYPTTCTDYNGGGEYTYCCPSGYSCSSGSCYNDPCQYTCGGSCSECQTCNTCTNICDNVSDGTSCSGGTCSSGSCAPSCNMTCGSCSECQTCNACNGTCENVSDGTGCSGGTCSSGSCVPSCTSDCGNSCGGCTTCDSCSGSCVPANEGSSCGNGGTCSSGSCVGECSYDCGGGCGECQTCNTCNNNCEADNGQNGNSCAGGTAVCWWGSCNP